MWSPRWKANPSTSPWSLVSALRLAAADTLGQTVATEIGFAARTGQIDKAAQLIAHAALGCAAGAIAAGDCVGGAVGATAGEVAAQVMLTKWMHGALESFANGTVDEVMLEADFDRFRAQGIKLAALVGGLTAALVGGEVHVGANAGANAAANNGLNEQISITLRVLKNVLGSDEAVATALTGGVSPEGLRQALDDSQVVQLLAGVSWAEGQLVEGVVGMGMQYAPDQTRAILGVLAAINAPIDATLVFVDNLTGKTVSKLWSELTPTVRQAIAGGTLIASVVIPARYAAELKGVSQQFTFAPNLGRPDWPELSGSLREAANAAHAALNGQGRINFEMGTFNVEQTMAMGVAWVGEGYRITSKGYYESADGLRQFRPPTPKDSSYAITGVQANFEQRSAPQGAWGANGHVDVSE